MTITSGGNGEPVRVLLVDDSEDARSMYAHHLAWSGFELLEAADGAQAVAHASSGHPDVIVMDLSLPGIDGWAAARAIKADARTSAIPIVALSGYASGRASDETLFAAFLTKPCLPDDLVGVLRSLLPGTEPGPPG